MIKSEVELGFVHFKFIQIFAQLNMKISSFSIQAPIVLPVSKIHPLYGMKKQSPFTEFYCILMQFCS